MRKRLTDYIKKIDDLITNPPPDVDWSFECREHLVQIQQFQHERLIHLLVTATTFIVTIAAVYIGLTISSNAFFIVIGLFCFLFMYLRHYFFLELNVIYLYEQYDKMLDKNRKQRKQTQANA